MESQGRTYQIKRCVIITGMSGGGKSSALNVFEDQGFYAIDNLPPTLLPQLLDVLVSHPSAVSSGVAAVMDVRGGELLNDLENVLPFIRKKVGKLEILFVDASDECLLRRFETTRRMHPLAANTTILGGIAKERELLRMIKKSADTVIDTSDLKTPEFKAKLLDVMGMSSEKLSVIISSFGFKYGIPQDSDYVLDVRFLPNPNYVDELHLFSGKDKPVQKYLSDFDSLEEFISKAEALLEFVSSVYSSTGKKQLHIAIGCTGGRHRSVAVAEMIASLLRKHGNNVIISHRDIGKGSSPI
ncbi:MAG: RNase adapter RapZ [Synergistaceae bacterium]|nr:RNase adapter RapZ [Synergistaceae bacterium]